MKRLLLLPVLLSPTPSASTERPRPAPTAPNVVLITLDTLRQDHVSSYGHEHRTTPFLDRLASRGVRFANAYSTSSWTVPSLVSLLTSLDPMTHGINYGYSTEREGVILDQSPLGPELVLMPELLKHRGYHTFGVTASDHLQPSLGFSRGFDVYLNRGFVRGQQLQQSLHAVAARIARARPFFVWVHLFDAHAPYDSNRPELADYLDGQAPNRELLGRIEGFAGPQPFLALDLEREPAALAHIHAAYDSDVRETDDLVASLFNTLGIGTDDLVVITADHGEELHDHGSYWHGHTLFEELLRVPLIICLPGRRHAGQVVEQRVSLLDVRPTILSVLGIPCAPSAQGRNLLPLLEGRAIADADLHATTGKLVEIESLISGTWKYIRNLETGEAMLFDLERDPGERLNLVTVYPDKAAELHRRLATTRMRVRRTTPVLPPLPMREERIEAMRALGYLQ